MSSEVIIMSSLVRIRGQRRQSSGGLAGQRMARGDRTLEEATRRRVWIGRRGDGGAEQHRADERLVFTPEPAVGQRRELRVGPQRERRHVEVWLLVVAIAGRQPEADLRR